MALVATDDFLVSRSGINYKLSYETLEEALKSASVTVGDSAPIDAEQGDLWYSSIDGRLYVYYEDINSSQWVDASPPGIGDSASVGIGAVPPAKPSPGDMWWDSGDTGQLFIWYEDADSGQWVPSTPSGGGGGGAGGGASVEVGQNPPLNPGVGDLWYDTGVASGGRLYIYYVDAGGDAYWVDTSPGGSVGEGDRSASAIISDTAPVNSTLGDLWWDSSEGRLYVWYQDDSGDTQWVEASPQKNGYWKRDETNGIIEPILDTDDIVVGGGAIELNASGIGSFTDLVKVAGTLRADRTGGHQSCIEAMQNNVANARIFADGSAEFAGTNNGQPRFTIANEGQTIINSSASNAANEVFQIKTNNGGASQEKVRINADGSASFAGEVLVGADGAGLPKVRVNSNGYVNIQGVSTNSECLSIYDNSASLKTSLLADGSANFSGSVKSEFNLKTSRPNIGNLAGTPLIVGESASNTYTDPTNASRKFGVYADGSVYIGNDETVDVGPGRTANTIELNGPNGSASFAGKGTFGDDVRVTSGRFHATAIAGSNVWSGLQAGNGTPTSTIASDGTINGKNVTFNLEADDDTKYTSTTNADGETELVYNGATLDVKDRLTKVDSALTGLKAALASTTDYDSLKAALISALTDI